MFNVGLPELIVLIVIGVIFFGPEKLPELARKAARVVKYLQGVANDAKGVLAEHVGPEFADLELRDLTPQKLAQKYLGEALREIEEVKSDLAGVRSDLETVAGQTAKELAPSTTALSGPLDSRTSGSGAAEISSAQTISPATADENLVARESSETRSTIPGYSQNHSSNLSKTMRNLRPYDRIRKIKAKNRPKKFPNLRFRR